MSRALIVIACYSILSCVAKEGTSDPVKLEQYYVQGEVLYMRYCANCHQKDGSGLGLVFPPVDKSDYIDTHLEKVVCIIKNGVNGELIVNGKKYNQSMPGIPTLTDLEVAEIATYLYNNWGREKGIVEVKEATKLLSTCMVPAD